MIVSVSQAKLQLARGLFFPLASFLLLLRLRSPREVFSFPLERLHLLGDNYAHSFQRFFPLTRPFHSLVFNFQTFHPLSYTIIHYRAYEILMSLARGLTFPLAKSSWLAALTQFLRGFPFFLLRYFTS